MPTHPPQPPTLPPNFRPGFRLSKLDIHILLLGTLTSLAVATIHPPVGLAIAFVVAHFFLFCNILRMSRPFELLWASTFCILILLSLTTTLLSWPLLFTISLLLTLILALLETRRPSYHGILWQRLNPNLPLWFQSHNPGQKKSLDKPN